MHVPSYYAAGGWASPMIVDLTEASGEIEADCLRLSILAGDERRYRGPRSSGYAAQAGSDPRAVLEGAVSDHPLATLWGAPPRYGSC
jgi:hypothetical protein